MTSTSINHYPSSVRRALSTAAAMASIKEGNLNPRRLVLSLMAMGLTLLLTSGVAHAAPANDDFANAQEIPDLQLTRSYTNSWQLQATVSGTNVGATKESGEPDHANDPGGKSVWYEWTPEESGTTIMDTFNSDFDTVLGVYTGSAVDGLTEVASNENAPHGGSGPSWVRFAATAGTTYRIAVDGHSRPGYEAARSGDIALKVAFDNHASPPRISSPANNSFDTDGSFVVSGDAEILSTVKLYEGDTLKGGGTDFGYGWGVTLTEVADGSHTYTATATDYEFGNTSETVTLTVIVDTIAPDAPRITTPAQNAHSNAHSLTLSGSAEEGAKVELFEGEASKGEATTGSDDAWSIDLEGVEEGTHSYTARATDAAGNASQESEARTVVVDKSAPTLDLLAPLNKATGVKRDARPAATFSDEMDPDSLETSVKLYQWNAKKKKWQPVPVTVSVEGKTATLDPYPSDPERLLGAKKKYKVTVTTGAKNLAGLPLGSAKSWTFTTR